MDALYVTRTRPTNVAFFDWNALDDARVEPAEPADARWIFELVARHEGPASAKLAAQLVACPARRLPGLPRARTTRRFGFLALLDIGEAGRSAPVDPAIAAARAFVERHGPAAEARALCICAGGCTPSAYQAVTAAINLTAMHVVSHCMTRPGMAWNFVAMADPAFWAAHFDGVNFPRAPEADFEVGGRRYGVFAHDWRVEPPADWMMGGATPMPFAAARAGPGRPRRPEPGRLPARRARRPCATTPVPTPWPTGPLRSSPAVAGRAGRARRAPRRSRRLLREAAEALLVQPARPEAPPRRLAHLLRAAGHAGAGGGTARPPVQHLPPPSGPRHRAHRRWLWHRERALPPPEPPRPGQELVSS